MFIFCLFFKLTYCACEKFKIKNESVLDEVHHWIRRSVSVRDVRNSYIQRKSMLFTWTDVSFLLALVGPMFVCLFCSLAVVVVGFCV